MTRLAALALIAVLAAPAHAITRYVSPTGLAGPTYGFSTTTPATLAYFNTTADKGDTCLIMDGNYGSTKIQPRGTGTPDSFIVYIGDVSTPANVVVPGIDIDSTLGAYRCISVKGVLATGDLSLKTDSCYYAGYDSISYCTIQGQATIQGRSNVVLYSNSIGTGDASDKLHVTNGMKTGITYVSGAPVHNWQRYRSTRVDSLRIIGNTFRLGTTTGNNAATWRGVNQSTVDGNRFYLYGIDNRDTHLNTWYDCAYNTVTDNLFEGTVSQGGTVPITYIMNLRDNNVRNVWARDTLVQAETSARPLKVAFNTSGNNRDYGLGNPEPFVTRTYDFGDSNNTFTELVIRVGGDVECQSKSDNNVYTFNSIAMGGVLWLGPYNSSSWPDSGASDSIVFMHNTVYSEDGIGRIIYPENSKVTHAIFTSNILVAKNVHSTTSTRGHYGFYGPSATGGPSFVRCDSNLVFCSSAPQDSLWAVNLDFLSSNAACKVGTNSTWGQAPYSYDKMSRWGHPGLTKFSIFDFDPQPDPDSLAYSSDLWADGFVGAKGTPADVTSPVVTITAPTGSRLWATAEVMPLEFTTSDAGGVTEIVIEWGEGSSPASWSSVVTGLASTITSYNWTLPTFTTGYATVRVRAFDADGNVGVDTLTFRCDVEEEGSGPLTETP